VLLRNNFVQELLESDSNKAGCKQFVTGTFIAYPERYVTNALVIDTSLISIDSQVLISVKEQNIHNEIAVQSSICIHHISGMEYSCLRQKVLNLGARVMLLHGHGYKGKSQSIHNFHACLEIILEPFIGNQGKSKPIYANVQFHQKYNISENSGLSLNDEVPSGIICDAMDILYVLEMNLAFFSWYKRGEPFAINDGISISAVKRCLSILLSTIKEFTPCNHGNGWKLQKFHEILHLPIDIYMFGSPQNYDKSPTEHRLIETAK